MASSKQPGAKACNDCIKKCGKGKVSEEVKKQLEDAFAKLDLAASTSLLKRFLTREVFDEIKDISTPLGSTLLDCIQSGVENLDSSIGLYAADADCYMGFAPLFDAIINEYHKFGKHQKQPALHWGDPNAFPNIDDKSEFIVSTRVRCGRSLKDFPFNPRATEANYKDLEQRVSSFLSGLKGELKGQYYPLTAMSKQVQQQLVDEHLLFKEADRFAKAANGTKFWPTGRGIFFNENKTFLVWINEEDHVRIISMQAGGDLGAVYKRFVQGVSELESNMKFLRDPRLGYLTFCPTNLGTAIRASVHIKLPKLLANKEKLDQIAEQFHLQVRGTAGEHSDVIDNTLDISNKRRMGITEFEVVKEMYDGIKELIKIERAS